MVKIHAGTLKIIAFLSSSILASFALPADADSAEIVIFRATPQVVEREVVQSASPASLVASTYNVVGIDVSPAGAPGVAFSISNIGGSSTARPPTAAVKSGPFAIDAATTCNAVLDAGKSCMVVVKGTSIRNGAVSGSLEVEGMVPVVSLAGKGMNFPESCSSPGVSCGNGSVFLANKNGRSWYGVLAPVGKVVRSSASASCAGLQGGGWGLPDTAAVAQLGVSLTKAAPALEGQWKWTSSADVNAYPIVWGENGNGSVGTTVFTPTNTFNSICVKSE